jgi:hypothetical protein
MLASQIDVFNRLALDAPLTVRLHPDGLPTLEPDIDGVVFDGRVRESSEGERVSTPAHRTHRGIVGGRVLEELGLPPLGWH